MDNRCSLLAIVMLSALIVVGCGKSYPDYFPVSGKILYRDKPVTSGVIMFQPLSGPPASGEIRFDGTFELVTHGRAEGAQAGLNQVRITSRDMKGDGGEMALGRHLIPERYSQFTTSGFTARVKPGENEPFEFRLTD